jgi:hypothetical protein
MSNDDEINRPATWTIHVLAIAAIFGIAGALSYSGFCIKEFQWLSDDEVVGAAIGNVMNGPIHITETPSGQYAQFAPKKPVNYNSREEFRRLNPNCCKIVPHDSFYVSFWPQLFGAAAKSVYLTYTVRYTRPTKSPSRTGTPATLLRPLPLRERAA